MSATSPSVILNPTQWLLEIPENIHHTALQQSHPQETATAEWNCYLTQVISETLCTFLQEEGETATIHQADIERLDILNRWIPGSTIDWAGKRCIVLPNTTLDDSELIVPQEWIDIPAWAGDYFLAVQVDWDAQHFQVLGYATHQRIKQLAEYSASERMYHLDALHLIQDLNALSVARQLCPHEVTQAAIAPITTIAPEAAAQWIEPLTNSANPRLTVPFLTWAGLITQPEYLRAIARARSVTGAIAGAVTTLSQWFDGAIAQGWQTFESLLGSDLAPAYALRDGQADERDNIRRVKVLQLSEDTATTLLLVMEVAAIADGRLSVKLQLYPSRREQALPAATRLTLQTSAQEIIQTVTSREQDNMIQLKRFRCPYGFQFVTQVTQGATTIDIPFVV